MLSLFFQSTILPKSILPKYYSTGPYVHKGVFYTNFQMGNWHKTH